MRNEGHQPTLYHRAPDTIAVGIAVRSHSLRIGTGVGLGAKLTTVPDRIKSGYIKRILDLLGVNLILPIRSG